MNGKSVLRLTCIFPYNIGRCVEIYVTQMSPSLPASRSILLFNAQMIVYAPTGSPAFVLSLSSSHLSLGTCEDHLCVPLTSPG